MSRVQAGHVVGCDCTPGPSPTRRGLGWQAGRMQQGRHQLGVPQGRSPQTRGRQAGQRLGGVVAGAGACWGLIWRSSLEGSHSPALPGCGGPDVAPGVPWGEDIRAHKGRAVWEALPRWPLAMSRTRGSQGPAPRAAGGLGPGRCGSPASSPFPRRGAEGQTTKGPRPLGAPWFRGARARVRPRVPSW